MDILRIRKVADKNKGERVTRYHPVTGEPFLTDPTKKGDKPEPWPFVGVRIEDEPPTETSVSMRWVMQGVSDGWIELVGEQIDHKPGGPPSNPWAKTHTFIQASQVVLKTLDGNVRYNVRHNPGVYEDQTEASGRRVDWFYELELIT